MIIEAWKHKSWGNNIQITNCDEMEHIEIAGWLSQTPEENDEIRFKMKGGKILRYSVASVEDFDNPPDMFFAKLEAIAYL